MKKLIVIVKIFSTYFVLSIACFLMLRSIIGYTSFRDDVQFLLLKQDYVDNYFWKTAFYIHVFSAVLCLFAGFTQFSSYFIKNYRPLHRLMGKIYVYNILVVNMPTSMVMAFYANGGLFGKTAFLLLNILWFIFTYKAFIMAKNRDFNSHKNFMIRSYALTVSAITLRTWKSILSPILMIDPAQFYIINAWMGFVPNLLLAEFIIHRQKKK